MTRNIFEILSPSIFPEKEITAGVTQKNQLYNPPHGFSISSSSICHPSQVEINRGLLAQKLGFERRQLHFQKQIHSDIIRFVDFNSLESESDGLFTNSSGLVLNVSIADCCAILIYDPIKRIIMAIHSGWRGTLLNITAKGIGILEAYYGSSPADLLIFLSPCASSKNYEIKEDTAKYFNYGVIRKNDKLFLDNQYLIKKQLLDCACMEDKIEISSICTIEDENYHSFRRDGTLSGRMSAFIGLK